MQESRKNICELSAGDSVNGCYILKTVQIRTSSNGRHFLRSELMDRTGAIETIVWDYAGPITAADEGTVAVIRKGTVSEFRGSLQIVAGGIRLAQPGEEIDLSALVPTAPMDEEGVFQEVTDRVASMEDPDYRRLCEVMLERHKDAFRHIPAAKSVHHAFRGGLLMHTADMMAAADFLAELYGDIIDRSLLLAGTLLHDFGKEKEFTFSPLGLVTDYSVEGSLLGHLVIGAREVAQVAAELELPEEKSMLLQHLLLSHHGEPEFGAAVRPACAESELLSLIDKMDSRMEIYRAAAVELDPGSLSQRIFALDRRIYRHM